MFRLFFILIIIAIITIGFIFYWQNRSSKFVYEKSDGDFTNPERGFYTAVNLFEPNSLLEVRKKGFGLGHAFILLTQFRDKPISAEFLEALEDGLEHARNNNIKLILRFAYTENLAEADTDLKTILNHLKQLKPILNKYQDIITVLQAGFIGTWGEWHNSTNNLLAKKYQIVDELLALLPATRMIELRNPNDLQDIYPKALSSKDAFGFSLQSRVGFHNDCFLANQHDAGTYFPEEKRESLREYVKQLSTFTATGGETCTATPTEQRTDCKTALNELKELHWDYLNFDFNKKAIERWQAEGCFTEISKRLGYRLSLIAVKTKTKIKQGQSFNVDIKIANEGFGKVYNPRNIELILQNTETGQETIFGPSSSLDSRLLLPLAGQSKSIRFKVVSSDLEAANYHLFFKLADPLLAEKPLYNIRLANKNIWEEQTGYNDLNIEIAVISRTN